MGMERELVIREFQRDRIRLLAYIRALVGDPSRSEDIFQSVSVIVLQKVDEFIPGRDLHSWCRGIARNLILREQKSAHRLRTFQDDRLFDLVDLAFAENAESDLLEARRDQVHTCLDQLSPSSRELIELRYVSGLSLRQLSGKLRRSEGSIQVALSRIRKVLRECVQRRVQQGRAVRL
ncbi:MAG TPA: sigma-70 family RNA polymerase sigma factor [Planctomycetota bacterium]|nr:sigma-70 family RNA polymerase sigma factor [Planctomycetota bacterium]